MEIAEHILMSAANVSCIIFEYIGVGVILHAGIRGIVRYMGRKDDARLVLAR